MISNEGAALEHRAFKGEVAWKDCNKYIYFPGKQQGVRIKRK